MRYISFALKNSTRNRLRSLLTISSMAMSLCLLGILISTYNALFHKESTPGQALRVVVRHRVSLGQPLPYSDEPQIKRVPGVKEVSVWNWFGGNYKDRRDPKNFFARFGVEPKAFLTIRTQLDMPEAGRNAFINERTACIISNDLAKKLGLKVGDRITLKGDIYPVDLQLTLRGIFDDPDAMNSLFFNQEYLRQLLPVGRRDFESTFAVLVDSPENVPRIAKDIDALFANSPYPTKTESEQQFALSFVAFLGNIKLFLLSICAAVTFTILLVSGNTMAMSVRERIKEVGILKTLGFTNTAILNLIIGEAAVIALVGGIVGMLLATLITVAVGKVASNFVQQLQGLSMTPSVAVVCLGVAVLIGAISSFVPAFNAARTNILDSLRYSG